MAHDANAIAGGGQIRRLTTARAVIWLAGGAIGLLVGREIAYERSAGGLLAGAVVTGVAVVADAAIVLVGILGLVIRRGRINRPLATTFGAAIVLPAGGVLGASTAALTGGIYRQPVVLTAPADAVLTLGDGDDSFVFRPHGQARCSSGDDTDVVASVTGLSLGELAGGTLRGSIDLPAAGSRRGEISLFIDGADLADGASQPTWSGPIAVDALAANGTSATARFEALPWTD